MQIVHVSELFMNKYDVWKPHDSFSGHSKGMLYWTREQRSQVFWLKQLVIEEGQHVAEAEHGIGGGYHFCQEGFQYSIEYHGHVRTEGADLLHRNTSDTEEADV